MRRAACRSLQFVVRLLPDLHAYSISIITHSYDAIRTIIQPDKTTNEETDGHGRDSHSTAVLRTLSGTYISCTVKATNGRLPDKCTVLRAQQGTFLIPTFSTTDRRLSHAFPN